MRKELIRRQVVVNSTTTKFTYSTEFLTYKVIHYFVAVHPHYKYERSGWRAGGYDCSVHHTMEEAQAAVVHTARVWDWDPKACYIKAMESTELVVKHHRNKVKG